MAANAAIWDDVHFDYGAAARAVQELGRAKQAVEDNIQFRMSTAPQAQDQWFGRYRQEFDDALNRSASLARDIVPGFAGVASGIRNAIGRAQAEQRARERARMEHWNAIARAEDLKAQQAQANHLPPYVVTEHQEKAAHARTQAAIVEQESVNKQRAEQAQMAAAAD